MATNFFNQFPKLPWKLKDQSSSTSTTSGNPSPSSSSSSPSSPPSGGYRPRKSISESHLPQQHVQSRLLPQASMSLINRGLLNPTGENNCFLNSAVQILWHIDVFRRSFRKVKGHMCVEKACIFCALKELFNEFQHGGQSAIPPDILRRAMADCYEEQHRFQLGLMDDAAECFEKILEQIHIHLTGSEDMDTCSAKHCLSHQKFSLTILERTECVCGATSEPLSFVQFVHYISSSAIAKEAEKYAEKDEKMHSHEKNQPLPPASSSTTTSDPPASNPATQDATPTPTASEPIAVPESSPSTTPKMALRPRLYSASQVHFGKILNMAGSFGEYRQCPDFERCKQKVAVKRILLNCPDIVCLGMIWDSAQPSVEEIMSVVLSIGLTLQLNELFDHVFADNAQINQYNLTALIAYYGRHYSTFCYHSKLREWVYFDDAKFRTVGSEWDDVCEEIRKAHYQPLLLVYTNPFGEEMDMSEAPKVVAKMPPPQPKGVAKSEPLPSIKEEAVTKATNDGKKAEASSAEVSKKSSEKSPASSKKSSASDTRNDVPQSHGIDPMTLSLIPLSRNAVNASKSTSPVVENNFAHATPTSEGTTPTSALDLSRTFASGGVAVTSGDGGCGASSSGGDLMSFSVSPALVEELLKPDGGSKVGAGGQQLEASSTANEVDDDLIKFSLTPAQLGISHTVPISHSNSRSNFGSNFQQSPALTTTKAGYYSPQSHSSTPPLKPAWEHFSDTSAAKPVVVAPQKLIPPTKKGVSKPGNHDNTKPDKQPSHISQDWTNVTKTSGALTAPPSSSSGGVASPAVRELQRIASLSDDEGAWQVGGDFKLESVTMSAITTAANSSDETVQSSNTSNTFDRRFSPLPPTPDDMEMPALQISDKSPSTSRRVAKSSADSSNHSTLLDDLEYAFPSADKLFDDSPQLGVRSKVNQKAKGQEDGGRKFDYADVDVILANSTPKRGVAVKGPSVVDNSKVDYVEVRTTKDPPRQHQPQKVGVASKIGSGQKISKEDETYFELVDVTVDSKQNNTQAAKADPVYAIPSKTRQAPPTSSARGVPRTRPHPKKESGSGLFSGPAVATPSMTTAFGTPPVAPERKMAQATNDIISRLSESTRRNLHEAQDLFAQAEASTGSDDTVAMMLYQQFNNLLFQALQDPLIKATPTLQNQIRTKREEGMRRCQALRKQTSDSQPQQTTEIKSRQGECKRCGKRRDLGEEGLCGPCQLRERISRK